MTMNTLITLRDLLPEDLPTLFEQQIGDAANYMAAFISRDPKDRAAFMAHWQKISRDKNIRIKIIIVETEIAGYVLSYPHNGKTELSYWLGEEFWGKGIASEAAKLFLMDGRKPLYARVAKDNLASLKVLRKCGFEIYGEESGFSNARGEVVEEYLLKCPSTVDL